MIVLFVASLLPLILTSQGEVVSASPDPDWWDSNWQYRAPITLTVHPDDYQIKIVLDKVDNLNSHCLDNFQDVRFTENDGGPELNFWIENYISGDNAVFWVRRAENDVPGDNQIYCYYGNASAGSAENGNATFMFFDTFPGTAVDTDKWYQYGEESISVANSELTMTTTTTEYSPMLDAKENYGYGIILGVRLKFANTYAMIGISDQVGVTSRYSAGDSARVYIYNAAIFNYGTTNNDTLTPVTPTDTTLAANVYFLHEIKRTSTSITFYKNGTLNGTSDTNLPDTNIHPFLTPAYGDPHTIIVDWTLIRKYVSLEPTASVGDEEAAPSVGVPSITVPRVFASVYTKGESGTVWAQVLDTNGDPVNAATVTLTVWEPDGDKYLDAVSMDFVTGSNGIYKYAITAPSEFGTFLCDVTASWNGSTAYGCGEFQVASWAENILSINPKLDEIAAGVGVGLSIEVTRYYLLNLGDLQEFYVTIVKGTNVDWATITLEDPKGTLVVDNTSMSNPAVGSYYYSFSTSGRESGGWLATIVAKDENLTTTYRGFWRLGGEGEAVGYLTLTLLDNETNEPIEGVKVELYKAGTLVESKYARWDGKAFLDIMNWGTHELKWSKDGYKTETMDIDLTVSSDLTLKMVPTEKKAQVPPITWILAALIFGGVLVPLVYYGSGKKAKAGFLFISFILPVLLLCLLWFAGVVG